MAVVAMLSCESLFQKAVRFSSLVDLALDRRRDSDRQMTILHLVGSREPVPFSGDTWPPYIREKIVCDFTNAANLELMDRHILPVISQVIDEAGKRDMTAILPLFSDVALYAVRDLESVSAKDRNQIARILYPPPPVEVGRMLAFPSRPPR